MKLNTFIYYGAEITKQDYENFFKKLDKSQLYSTIFSKGLNFREYGEMSSTWHYIVGKELYWSIDNSIINLNDQFNSIDNNNILLSDEEKLDIRKKLLELNITNEPQYKIFSCW